jgi:hypothetical protein
MGSPVVGIIKQLICLVNGWLRDFPSVFSKTSTSTPKHLNDSTLKQFSTSTPQPPLEKKQKAIVFIQFVLHKTCSATCVVGGNLLP